MEDKNRNRFQVIDGGRSWMRVSPRAETPSQEGSFSSLEISRTGLVVSGIISAVVLFTTILTVFSNK